jgi:photosystem II stability/assembly factor-like uncharacterized protein
MVSNASVDWKLRLCKGILSNIRQLMTLRFWTLGWPSRVHIKVRDPKCEAFYERSKHAERKTHMFSKSNNVKGKRHVHWSWMLVWLLAGLAILAPILSRPEQRASAAPTAQSRPGVAAWEHQGPLPTGANLSDIDMISASEGWAVGQYIGNGGVIIHTTNGGATWSYHTTGVEEPNYAVRFLDSMHGWVASNNTVFYTTDGGNTWLEGAGLAGSFYFLEFATLNDGFVTTGVDRGYFRTTDGGQTWHYRALSRDVAGIQFFDANNGVASAEDGVFHTTDRGNTWTFTAGHGGSTFINHNVGFAVSGNTSERTTDGGATWQSGSMPGGAWVYDSHFIDANNGWATGAGFQILRTTDGGMTWSFSRNPNTYPYLIYDGWGIDFVDPAHVVAVGGYAGGALRGGGVIFSTSDAGATWIPRQNGTASTTFRITALDADHAWSANEYGETLWTTDGGVHWNLASVPGYQDLRDIEFADFSNGWVVGGETQGIVARSTDGGRTWHEQFANLGEDPLYGLDVINRQTAIAVGGGLGGPIALRTTDGGNTWGTFDARNGSIMFDVFFINPTTGWIVGHGGRISKSTDGGQTWTPQNSPVTSQLWQVSFADENNGWAVGAFGATILHTTNGGQNWVVQNAGLPSNASVQGVSAVSPTTAWIATGATDDPHVFRTTNGGATWVEEQTGTHEYWNSWSTIFFINADYGWVGGTTSEPRGGILRRVPEASTPTPTGTSGPPTTTSLPTLTAVPTNTPAATCPPRVVTGSITEGDPITTQALDWNEIASTCVKPKGCPGGIEAYVNYDTYTYTNSSGSARCVTVEIDGTQCGFDIESVFSAAYLGSYDPGNACLNYLADPGFYSDPFAGPATYSFNVAAGATFVVVVQSGSEEAGCSSYTLTVSGLDVCTTPTAVVTTSPTIVPTTIPTNTPAASPSATRTAISTPSRTSTAVITSTPTGTAVVTVVPPTSTAIVTSTPTSIVSTATVTTATATTVTGTTTPSTCNVRFADVPEQHTFYDSIRCLACRGIVSGYADGTFRPDSLVTRGQLAKIVSNAANFAEAPGTQIFQDVAPDHTFYEWINRLTNRGYMSGYSCGSPGEPCVNNRPYFRPFANATRAQTSKIVANAARYNEPPTGQAFEDVPPTHPFYAEIQRLASRNIMGGYNCGGPGEPCGTDNKPYFRPYNNVTRGQSAKIVANTFYPNCQTP